MKIQGAVIKEQGITFAIVVVKNHVIQQKNRAVDAIQGLSRYFLQMPIVLMAQNYRGTPTYYGRQDIVNFLSNIPFHSIPWKEYTFN